jgi:hypothetical protein
MISGYMLAISTFGWPLLVGGTIKAAYDLLLLINFRQVRPPEETGAPGRAAITAVGPVADQE